MKLAGLGSVLEREDDVDLIWSRACEMLARIGLPYVIYLTVDADRQTPYLLTTIPQIYETNDIARDPFLDHCCDVYEIGRTGPDYFEDYDLPEEDNAYIRACAALTEFRSGLSIPVRLRGSQRYGGFNLGSPLDRARFDAKFTPLEEELRFFCLLIHRRIEELTLAERSSAGDFRERLIAPEPDGDEHPAIAALSPREREIAYLIARGKTRKECAILCDISLHTVSEYAKSAYSKLGVRRSVELARLFG